MSYFLAHFIVLKGNGSFIIDSLIAMEICVMAMFGVIKIKFIKVY